jgi:hypothetical protein
MAQSAARFRCQTNRRRYAPEIGLWQDFTADPADSAKLLELLADSSARDNRQGAIFDACRFLSECCRSITGFACDFC